MGEGGAGVDLEVMVVDGLGTLIAPLTPLPISQTWLECVDDELSALAAKTFSLSSPNK